MHTCGHANLVKYTSFKIRYLWRTGAILYCAGSNINLTCTESRGFSLSRLSPPFLLFFGFGSFPPGIARYVSLSENYERNVKRCTQNYARKESLSIIMQENYYSLKITQGYFHALKIMKEMYHSLKIMQEMDQYLKRRLFRSIG